jgi:hypothetical protein
MPPFNRTAKEHRPADGTVSAAPSVSYGITGLRRGQRKLEGGARTFWHYPLPGGMVTLCLCVTMSSVRLHGHPTKGDHATLSARKFWHTCWRRVAEIGRPGAGSYSIKKRRTRTAVRRSASASVADAFPTQRRVRRKWLSQTPYLTKIYLKAVARRKRKTHFLVEFSRVRPRDRQLLLTVAVTAPTACDTSSCWTRTKASTTAGSNCVPEHCLSSAMAASCDRADRYARSLVIAS